MKELIRHPELFDRETLYELRSTLALHPYFQTARLLMLHNLFLMHDPAFDEELRRASLYISDRNTIFNLVEAAHYQLESKNDGKTVGNGDGRQPVQNRTVALIDTFLDSIPDTEDTSKRKYRKPTPADAAVDYVAYLLETEGDFETTTSNSPQMKGQDLIDNFLQQERPRIVLGELPQTETPVETASVDEKPVEEEYFTETLARIYIKQGRYQKALDIIQRLAANLPDKNIYFADQIRFLEKLVINSNNKK